MIPFSSVLHPWHHTPVSCMGCSRAKQAMNSRSWCSRILQPMHSTVLQRLHNEESVDALHCWLCQQCCLSTYWSLEDIIPEDVLRCTLEWRHNGLDGVSNHQPHHCLRNRLFRSRSKKTSELRVPGLCEGNSPVTGEFPAHMASNAENVSIWWRHHAMSNSCETALLLMPPNTFDD